MNKQQQKYQAVQTRIPWGTQTNGKRPNAALADVTPYFFEEADGCRVKDVEGNWYIDFRSSLGPIILGYKNTVVDEAVRKQMEKGVVFSLASPMEDMVAQRLIDSQEGVEKVRFLKSGNEANLAALRLARAFTGRDKIVTCGYHGHGDWFSCGTGPENGWGFPRTGNGVPEVLDHLVTRVPYGDMNALEEVFRKDASRLAAVMMVAYDWGPHVASEFVEKARELTLQHGTVLIFDQVLTGFRLANGGAQEYFGVVPDLSTYAKAIANGFPLSVFCGRKDVMSMLDRVLITTTHAGEALSLAAADATLRVIEKEPVIDHVWKMGRRLMEGFDRIASELGMSARSSGLPPAPRFVFSPGAEADQRSNLAFWRELLIRGVFPSSNFLVNYSHKEKDIDETLDLIRQSLVAMNEKHVGVLAFE